MGEGSRCVTLQPGHVTARSPLLSALNLGPGGPSWTCHTCTLEFQITLKGFPPAAQLCAPLQGDPGTAERDLGLITLQQESWSQTSDSQNDYSYMNPVALGLAAFPGLRLLGQSCICLLQPSSAKQEQDVMGIIFLNSFLMYFLFPVQFLLWDSQLMEWVAPTYLGEGRRQPRTLEFGWKIVFVPQIWEEGIVLNGKTCSYRQGQSYEVEKLFQQRGKY